MTATEGSRQPADIADGVAAYYDRLASVYGEGEVFAARRAAVFDVIAADLVGARAVLDLGCGNGTYTAEFVARAPGARVVGADLSTDMLHASQRRLGARAQLVQANATALPFSAACFDRVFMSHVLQLVDDIERCVAEVAACLSPGGLWITTVGVGGWREAVSRLLGTDPLPEFAALVASHRSRAATDDESRVTAACARAGLQPTWRTTSFEVTWAAMEEWVRIRWLTVADDATRERAEAWLAQLRPSGAGRMLPITETLLVARRPSR